MTVKTTKKPVKAVVGDVEEKDEEDIVINPTKSVSKKPAEIDAVDILPEVDEKIEDDAPVLGIEDEDSEDVPSLDSEDLNPFGDKWEE